MIGYQQAAAAPLSAGCSSAGSRLAALVKCWVSTTAVSLGGQVLQQHAFVAHGAVRCVAQQCCNLCSGLCLLFAAWLFTHSGYAVWGVRPIPSACSVHVPHSLALT
jgi:hypothetical protein